MDSAPASRHPLAPNSAPAAAIGLLAGCLLFQFYGNHGRGYIDTSSLFYWWGYQWVNPASETQHGWLILGLSGWLFWRNLGATPGVPHLRSEISNLRSIAPAMGAMAAGLALHALGFAAQQARVSILALLLFVWGGLRLAGGRRWGAAAAFPIAFMVFAIPITALDSIGFWLRVWVVNASGAIARGVGIPVLQNGTLLIAPDGSYNYDVAAACSGIRSLTAMAALSLLAGYLNFHSWWRRALILLLCFPLVYAGNVARIISIVFAAQVGGPKWGDVAHEVMGYGVFLIVLGGAMAAVSILRRWWLEEPQEKCHPLDDTFPEPKNARGGWGGAACVVLLVAAEIGFLHHLQQMPPRGLAGVVVAADGLNPVELPAFLGTDWIGRRAEVSAVEREILPQDTGFSRKNYISLADSRQSVFLSIVLSGRDRTSIHRPELCLVGQGWTIAGSVTHTFQYPGATAATFAATVLRVRREVSTARGKETVPQLVAYWFVGGDTVVGTHGRRLLHDAWNRVVHARADRWAYVLMQTDARDGEAAALARMQTVLNATLPSFQAANPGTAKEARTVTHPMPDPGERKKT